MRKIILIVLALFIAINLAVNIYQHFNSKKIGFVRSNELVYGYTGMKEMQNKFQIEAETWQAQHDTLKYEYRLAVEKYQKLYNSSTEEEREMQEKILQVKQENIARYEYNIQEKAQIKEEEMLQGVLNQINLFVKDYGEKNGYTIIFGTTANGNILYGEDYIDITERVLKALNEEYL